MNNVSPVSPDRFHDHGGWYRLQAPAPHDTIARIIGLNEFTPEYRDEEAAMINRGTPWGLAWSHMTGALPDAAHISLRYLGDELTAREALEHLATLRITQADVTSTLRLYMTDVRMAVPADDSDNPPNT